MINPTHETLVGCLAVLKEMAQEVQRTLVINDCTCNHCVHAFNERNFHCNVRKMYLHFCF